MARDKTSLLKGVSGSLEMALGLEGCKAGLELV